MSYNDTRSGHVMRDLQNHEDDLLIEREILEYDIPAILTAVPDAPDLLAHLFIKLKRAIENESQPTNQIRETLKIVIELTYLRTKAHAAALELYTLYQQGQALVGDFPLNLINAAIERCKMDHEFKHEANEPPDEESDSEE
jgi:hypothetical protein